MLALLLTACTPFPMHAQSCLFGGATVAEDAACVCKRFGDAGLDAAKNGYLHERRIDLIEFRTMHCQEPKRAL